MHPPNAARPAPESPGNGPRKTSLLGGLDPSPLARESVRAQAQHRLRRQRLVEKLHRLGPAPLSHFLREIEQATGADLTQRLERYSLVDPEFVRALGGDRFPPALIAIGGRPD
jgi:hypothetical protein